MILILNKTPLSKATYSKWLPNCKKNCILLSAVEAANSNDQVLETVNQFHSVKWFDNWEKNAFIELYAMDLIKKHNIQYIVAPSEVDVLRANRLRAFISGASNTDSENHMNYFRNKLRMRQVATKAKIPQPKYLAVSSLIELMNAADQLGFPFIIKPLLNGGSIGVNIISNQEDINNFLSNKALQALDQWNSFIAEEYVCGSMIHADGIVNKGLVEFNRASLYINSCLDVLHGKDHGSIPLSASSSIHDLAQKHIDSFIQFFDCKDSFVYHAEFFIKNGDLAFCEIAARPGGGRIQESLLHTTQWFDVMKTQVLLQVGLFNIERENITLNQNTSRTGWYLYPPTKGLMKKFNKADLPKEFHSLKSKYQVGDRINNPTHSGDELVSLLFNVSESQNEQGAVDNIRDWVKDNIEIRN